MMTLQVGSKIGYITMVHVTQNVGLIFKRTINYFPLFFICHRKKREVMPIRYPIKNDFTYKKTLGSTLTNA